MQTNFLNSVKESKLQHLKKKYYNVFEPKLGKCTKLQVSIHLRDDAPVKPAFSNTRPIPFAIRQKVQDELDRLKQMARRYVWWPNVDKDVENIVRNCMICRQSAKA